MRPIRFSPIGPIPSRLSSPHDLAQAANLPHESHLIFLSALVSIASITAGANPLHVDGHSFYGVDPSATVTAEGKLYMVVTTDSLDWGKQVGWDLYTTEDLFNWTILGTIFYHEDSAWGINNALAPDLTVKDGTFYLHFYFRNSGPDGSVGIAVADTPTAP